MRNTLLANFLGLRRRRSPDMRSRRTYRLRQPARKSSSAYLQTYFHLGTPTRRVISLS